MKILKTSVTTLVVAAAMTAAPVFAGLMTHPIQATVQESEYFNGLYLGFGAGLVKPDAKIQYDFLIPDTINQYGGSSFEAQSQAKSENSGKYGFGANIFAGFGKVFDYTKYLGVEIFGNYFDPDMTLSSYVNVTVEDSPYDTLSGKFKTKIENDYSYGIFARAGYLFSPQTMFYILFGIDQSKFNVKSTATLNGFDTLFPPTIASLLTTTDKFHKTKIGYLPGAGIETVITDNVTLKMQYIYTFYSSFKHKTNIILPNGNGEPEPLKKFTTKVDPSKGMISLMLSWYLA